MHAQISTDYEYSPTSNIAVFGGRHSTIWTLCPAQAKLQQFGRRSGSKAEASCIRSDKTGHKIGMDRLASMSAETTENMTNKQNSHREKKTPKSRVWTIALKCYPDKSDLNWPVHW